MDHLLRASKFIEIYQPDMILTQPFLCPKTKLVHPHIHIPEILNKTPVGEQEPQRAHFSTLTDFVSIFKKEAPVCATIVHISIRVPIVKIKSTEQTIALESVLLENMKNQGKVLTTLKISHVPIEIY